MIKNSQMIEFFSQKAIFILESIPALMVTNIAFMIVAAILTLSGVIWNYSTTRSMYHQFTGTLYPTDYAARGLALLLAYAVLKKFKLRLPEYISFIAIIFWFYLITGTQVNLLLSLLLMVSLVAYPKVKQLFKKIKY